MDISLPAELQVLYKVPGPFYCLNVASIAISCVEYLNDLPIG